MILVTGATGNVGSQTARELRDRGAPVRAFVRDEGKARAMLGDGVELAVGDFGDAGSIGRALDGVTRVLVSSSDGPDKVAHEAAVIDAAASAGVELLVKASTPLAEAGSPSPPLDWNGRLEDAVRGSGVPFVILQSSFYMTNLLASAEPIAGTGSFFAPAGDGKIATIDPRDTGRVAAVVLTGDGHAGQTYLLTGPEAITHAQMAADLSAATGRPVEYVAVPDEALAQGLAQANAPDWLRAHLATLYPVIRADGMAETTDTVRALTGREPTPFATWANDHAAAFDPRNDPGATV